MQRCVPGSVQSFRPEVPSAQPSQTPLAQDAPGKRQLVAVLPGDLEHLAVVVRLLRADSEEGHGQAVSYGAAERRIASSGRVSVA